ncbi:restriction endonuclease subunit S [Alphaproteobacteria bacterium]|nr:restriction endonuclease subunit S [Alphaproteobacteria bacterium]
MTKNTMKNPALRFPEFANDWQENELGDICDKESSKIVMGNISENGLYTVYGASGMCGKITTYISDKPYIGIVKDGAGVGKLFFCEKNTSILGTLNKISEKKNINILFLYYLFKKINFQKYVIGSTIPHIYFKDYSKEKIKFPSTEEQNKIAIFLSAVDKSIKNTSNQINQSKLYKKSLMQKMFI